jgi:hypothetical protein
MKKLIRQVVNRVFARFIPLSYSPRIISLSLPSPQAYPQFCLLASTDYRFFNSFRRNPIYNKALEHVSRREGSEYLREIMKDPLVLSRMEDLKQNDAYGNPRTFDYPQVGRISPTTLRYAKVLADLKRIFRSLDGLSICEIGGGYGGQCRIINIFFQPASYCLVDIQPALMLAQRFLDHFTIPSTLSFKTMNELERKGYDLVLSNYAITELPRPMQEVYFEKVILPSRMGYITYNEISSPECRSYKRDEILRRIPYSEVEEEVPLTHPGNCIIHWGSHA